MKERGRPAYLRAERWSNEHTEEEIWGPWLSRNPVGFRGKAIEEAVWRRVTADPDASEEIEPENASEEDFEF
jgi:hypothetical protein